MTAAIITTQKISPLLTGRATSTSHGPCPNCKAGTCIVHLRISEGVLPTR